MKPLNISLLKACQRSNKRYWSYCLKQLVDCWFYIGMVATLSTNRQCHELSTAMLCVDRSDAY